MNYNFTNKIEEVIKQLKEELFKKFPDCGEDYTIIVYLWTDEDFKVECRYGKFDKNKGINVSHILHMFTYHQGKIDYVALEIEPYSSMQITETDNLI